MKKETVKKVISALLIIIGAALIAAPQLNNYLLTRKMDEVKGILEEITIEEIEENSSAVEDDVIYDFEVVEEVNITSTINEIRKFEPEKINKNIVGQLIIKDLNINIPILKGVTNSNLLIGAGTMTPGVKMGEGNYSLAGHYSNKGLLFGPLLKAEVGSRIKITDKRIVYEYEIYDTKLVEDTAFYMLDQKRAKDRGKPIISLMTCYYTSKNGQRFFVLGELVDQYPHDDYIRLE